MVRLSILEVTRKDNLAGKLALIIPVMTLTDGLWVATTRWIPIARASWANLAIGASISLPAVIIKSANSSMTRTIYGMNRWPFSGFNLRATNLPLYSLRFLQPASFKRSYRLSISIQREFKVLITFLVSVIIASSALGSLARKCLSILLNRVNSTFLGSTRTNFSWEGCFLYTREARIMFSPTDFP